MRFRLSLTHIGSDCQRRCPDLPQPLLGLLVAGALLAGCNAFDQDPQAHLQQARAYLAEADLRAAVIELKNALQADPNIPGAHRMLGEIYLLLGDSAGAERELIRAIELGDSSNEVQLRLIQALLQQGEHEQALVRIDAMPAGLSSREHSQLAVLTGGLHQARGDEKQARGYFEAALRDENGRASGHLGLARLALADRDWEAFEAHITSAQAAGATSGDIAIQRGEAALLKRQPKQAQENFSAAIDKPATELQARLGLTRALLAAGDPQRALSAAQDTVRRFPRSAPAYYLLALTRHRLGDSEYALDAARESLRLDAAFPPSMLLMGQIQLQDGLTAQAERTVRKITKAQPDHAGARTLLAAIQARQGHSEEAKQTLEPLLELNPPPTQALKILAQLELRDGNRSRGLTLLQQAAAGENEAAPADSTVLADDPRQEALLAVMRQLRNQEFDSALAAAEDYIHAYPDDVLGLNLLGTVYIAQGDADQARRYFLRAAELDESFAPARFNLARLDMLSGNAEQAEQRLQSLVKIQPDYLDARLALADLAFRANRPADGIEHLKHARRSSRTALQPRLALADWYLGQGLPKEALEFAQEAVDLAPAHPAALIALGRCWSALDQYRQAAEVFEKLTAAAPRSADAYFYLGVSLVQLQELERAEKVLLRARELNAEHTRTLLALGALALERGDTEIALELANQVQVLDPESADGYGLVGDIFASDGNYSEALEPYRRAYELEPNGIRVTRLYQTYIGLGQTEQAQELIANWLQENREDIVARLALAEAHAQEGDLVGAITVYEQVLDIDNDNIVALNNLAWLYFKSEDKRALAYARRAYGLAPELPDVLDTYGWILLNEGQKEQALAILKRARNRTDSPEIRYHFAIALETAGHTDEARIELEQLLRADQDFPDRSAAQSLLKKLN